MKDKFFLDSNICLYLFDKDESKSEKAKSLIDDFPIISTQVINENINVCLRKLKLTTKEAFKHAGYLKEKSYLVYVKYETIRITYTVMERYNFSYFDSLIIASALENECSLLYSEDLQSNQVIFNNLKIINPFL